MISRDLTRYYILRHFFLEQFVTYTMYIRAYLGRPSVALMAFLVTLVFPLRSLLLHYCCYCCYMATGLNEFRLGQTVSVIFTSYVRPGRIVVVNSSRAANELTTVQPNR